MQFFVQLRFISLFVLLFVLLSSSLHAEEKIVVLDQLEVRNDLRYVTGQEHTFTGKAVSYFADGMQKLQISFDNGLKHGKEIAWYKDGQLRYVVRYIKGEPQSQGSTWYAHTNPAKLVASELQFCDKDDTKDAFCEVEQQESSHIEFTP